MALNDNNSPDSVLYLAPFSTAQSIISIQGLDTLADRIINKVEIEFNQFDQMLRCLGLRVQKTCSYTLPKTMIYFFFQTTRLRIAHLLEEEN